MRQAAKAIYGYWRSIAPDTGIPARAAVDPRALKLHLPDLFMLERLGRSVFAFRLAGTRLCARYGRELRDHVFIRLWPAAEHARVLATLDRCLGAGEALVLSGNAATLDGSAVSFDILLMPLTDEDGRPTRILGAMLPANDFALREGAILVTQTLTRVGLPDSSELQTAPVLSAFAGARETRVSFLRVIDGARDLRPSPGSTPLSDAG